MEKKNYVIWFQMLSNRIKYSQRSIQTNHQYRFLIEQASKSLKELSLWGKEDRFCILMEACGNMGLAENIVVIFNCTLLTDQ